MAITHESPVISITQPAAERIREVLQEQEERDLFLRLFVTRGGCSGYSYGMTFDNEVREGDQIIEQHEVKLVVDPLVTRLMRGAQIDYVRSAMGEGFTVRNPNAISTCGCGHSFTTADDPGEADPCEEEVQA